MKQAVGTETAAILLEAIQGEGGVYPADPDFLITARELCDQYGCLLIIDEVQTGFGRTGKLFAIEHYSVKPDLLCLAKSIAGGLPMGAVLFNSAVKNIQPGLHASTFGGNPLACAVATTVLDVLLSEDLPAQAAQKGVYLLNKLNAIQSPLIREIRGVGLMIGIELKKKVSPYLRVLEEGGVLALPAGLSVIRLLPPLVINYDQLDRVAASLEQVLTANNLFQEQNPGQE